VKIIFFDSNCLLCLWSVRFVLRHDKIRDIYFAAINSETARSFNFSKEDMDYPQSIIYFNKGSIFEKSDALFEIIKNFSSGWRALRFLRIIPQKLRDWFYDRVANNRYRIFGRARSCILPPANLTHRFL